MIGPRRAVCSDDRPQLPSWNATLFGRTLASAIRPTAKRAPPLRRERASRVRLLPGVPRDHAIDLDSLTCPRVRVDPEHRWGSARPCARLALAHILGRSLRPTFLDDPHRLALVKLAIADVGHSWSR